MTAEQRLSDLRAEVREIAATLHCQCWYPDLAEYAPTPCARCRLERAIEQTGAAA